jgi:acetate kinase
MDTLLVINAGSSSVKFQLFGLGKPGELVRLIKGQVSGIGTMAKFVARRADAILIDRTLDPVEGRDIAGCLAVTGAWIKSQLGSSPVAVGHRVAHGGPRHDGPIRVTPEILTELDSLSPLAPLHQPVNLAPIRILLESNPAIPQIACFDTAFHRSHPDVADVYAIPARFHAAGVRRYGFHGLSYEYIAQRLKEIDPLLARGRIVIAHLGSGASMCALANGRSVECTMGFTALDGLPMGTRSGQLDPGVVLHLQMQEGLSAMEVQNLLYRECGLKGLSGISNDVRDLEASSDPRAAFALDYFAYRSAMSAGSLAVAMGGLDGLVFTGGIGEHSAKMRGAIGRRLGLLGIAIDATKNAAGTPCISSPDSLPVLVEATDEELTIARHTLGLVHGGGEASNGASSTRHVYNG